MAFLETKHTMAAIDKIKKELNTFIFILSVMSMAIFSIYYIILIISNISSPLFLIIYVVLFLVVIISFIFEMICKNRKKDSKKTIRIKLERKRFISIFTKTFKYLAKSITCGIAIYEMIKQPNVDLPFLINIVSVGMLLIQLLSEFVICFANRYIDYLKLGFELDLDSSLLAKLILGKQLKAKSLESKVYSLQGDSIYTPQELKIIEMLSESAEVLKKENDEKLRLSIETSKKEIKELTSKKLSTKQKEKVEKKYELSKTEALTLIETPDKLVALLIKAEQLVEKLPGNISALKYIPEFLSLINNYVKKKYTDVSTGSIIATVAVIVYFVSPFDIIPDALPVIGYIDEAYVIGKCLELISDELEKFIIWRNKQIN